MSDRRKWNKEIKTDVAEEIGEICGFDYSPFLSREFTPFKVHQLKLIADNLGIEYSEKDDKIDVRRKIANELQINQNDIYSKPRGFRKDHLIEIRTQLKQ